MNKYIAVSVNAGNDNNGNPRRGWMIVEPENDARTVDFIDEQYDGTAKLFAKYGKTIARTGYLHITPKQYRELQRLMID